MTKNKTIVIVIICLVSAYFFARTTVPHNGNIILDNLTRIFGEKVNGNNYGTSILDLNLNGHRYHNLNVVSGGYIGLAPIVPTPAIYLVYEGIEVGIFSPHITLYGSEDTFFSGDYCAYYGAYISVSGKFNNKSKSINIKQIKLIKSQKDIKLYHDCKKRIYEY